MQAIKQMEKQLAECGWQAYYYSLYHRTVFVVLLSDTKLPSKAIIARGIAIRSPHDKDVPNWDTIRRFWALKRAIHGAQFGLMKTSPRLRASEPIRPNSTSDKKRANTLKMVEYAFRVDDKPVFKSQFAPVTPTHGKARRIELSIWSKICNQEQAK